MRRLLIALSLVVTAPASANDSSALLEAGGIVLTKSADVSMESEELWISRDLVRVSYVFRNSGPADVTTEVAFPVPPIPHCEDDTDGDCDGDIRIDKLPNPMHFKLTVDGKPQAFQTLQEVEKVEGAVAKLLVTHHWRQVFPKDRPVSITHEYVPVAGGFFTAPKDPAWAKQMSDLYCVGPKLLAAVAREPTNFIWAVHYILKTGANWKGPIKRFKLTIAKNAAKDRVSVCLPDTARTSATTFEVRRENFTPTDDLRILFIPAQS